MHVCVKEPKEKVKYIKRMRVLTESELLAQTDVLGLVRGRGKVKMETFAGK